MLALWDGCELFLLFCGRRECYRVVFDKKHYATPCELWIALYHAFYCEVKLAQKESDGSTISYGISHLDLATN